MKSSRLGFPHGTPWIFKKTQASKLGDAQGILSSSSTTIRSSPLKLYFYCFTYYVFFLDRHFIFTFSLFCFVCWSCNVGSQLSCLGERHAPLFYQNTLAFHLYLLSILSYCSVCSQLFFFTYIFFRVVSFVCIKCIRTLLFHSYFFGELNWNSFVVWLMCQNYKMSCM